MTKIYKLYYFIDNEINCEVFIDYNKMEEFVETNNIEIYKIEEGLRWR